MIVWFVAIGACGVNGIVDNPEILKALSPTYALTFLVGDFHIAFFSLGRDRARPSPARRRCMPTWATSAGRRSRTAVLGLVLPALHAELLRPGCAGACRQIQGERSVLSAHPGVGADSDGAAGHGGDGIASQAVITGAFSVASQAAQLGYLPTVAHRAHVGVDDRPDLRAVDQRMLMVAVLILVFAFRSSAALAYAFGMAVTGTITITTRCSSISRGSGGECRYGWSIIGGGAAAAGGSDVLRGESDQAGPRRVAAAAHRPHGVHGDDTGKAAADRHARAAKRPRVHCASSSTDSRTVSRR